MSSFLLPYRSGITYIDKHNKEYAMMHCDTVILGTALFLARYTDRETLDTKIECGKRKTDSSGDHKMNICNLYLTGELHQYKT